MISAICVLSTKGSCEFVTLTKARVVPRKTLVDTTETTVLLEKNRHWFLHYYGLRDWDWLRYVHRYRVGLSYRYRMRDRDSYLDRDLHGIRNNLLNREWHCLLYMDRVRFGHRDGVVLHNRNRDGNLDGVRDRLLYWDRVGLRDRDCHFLGDHDALDAADGTKTVGPVPQQAQAVLPPQFVTCIPVAVAPRIAIDQLVTLMAQRDVRQFLCTAFLCFAG